jgi:hypothetical protein
MKLFFLAVRGPWTKIAMVIAEIADAMRTDLPSGDDGHEIISERIQVLVRAWPSRGAGEHEQLAFQRGQGIGLKNGWCQWVIWGFFNKQRRGPSTWQ